MESCLWIGMGGHIVLGLLRRRRVDAGIARGGKYRSGLVPVGYVRGG